jgi:uncharacterized protein YlzI (FlbEa/FlbD family)
MEVKIEYIKKSFKNFDSEVVLIKIGKKEIICQNSIHDVVKKIMHHYNDVCEQMKFPSNDKLF